MLGALIMVSTVSVDVLSISTTTEPPMTQLSYKVLNSGKNPIWLVDDNWLVWRQKDNRIELSFARERMQPGVEAFGYFKPQVIKIESGNFVIKDIELDWPLTLDRIWNSRGYVTPEPGEFVVSIKVGYGLTRESDSLSEKGSVEEPILQWQSTAVSEGTMMVVPKYEY